jgi:hypothetical protein
VQVKRAQNNFRYLENVATLSIRDLQGARDDPGLVLNVELAFERLRRLGARDAQLVLHPELGHSFDLSAVDWPAFFGGARREPMPERVVRAAAREGEGRAWWVEVLDHAPSVAEVFELEISELRWAQMSERERRAWISEEADARTARLEVRRAGPDHYTATSRGVKRFRLLLPRDAYDPSRPVTLEWNGARITKKLAPSARVLLEDFAERFDRRVLPVAELVAR